MTAEMKCPTCEEIFDGRQIDSAPYCTPKCRQIDLGSSYNSSYRMRDHLSFSIEDLFKKVRKVKPANSIKNLTLAFISVFQSPKN